MTTDNTNLYRRLDEVQVLLADLREYLWSNPPTTGWGCLDHRADAERQELLSRLYDLLETREEEK